MPKKRILIHAGRRVAQGFTASELDRLVPAAIAAAERQATWGPGEEYEYLIEDEPYVIDGIECSSFTVCHQGSKYEVLLLRRHWGALRVAKIPPPAIQA